MVSSLSKLKRHPVLLALLAFALVALGGAVAVGLFIKRVERRALTYHICQWLANEIAREYAESDTRRASQELPASPELPAEAIDDYPRNAAGNFVDMWGNELRIEIERTGKGKDTKPEWRMRVSSPGPDGQWGAGADYTASRDFFTKTERAIQDSAPYSGSRNPQTETP